MTNIQNKIEKYSTICCWSTLFDNNIALVYVKYKLSCTKLYKGKKSVDMQEKFNVIDLGNKHWKIGYKIALRNNYY